MVHSSSNTILISSLKATALVLELNNYPHAPANQPTFLCTSTAASLAAAALAAEYLPVVPSFLTLFHPILCPKGYSIWTTSMDSQSSDF